MRCSSEVLVMNRFTNSSEQCRAATNDYFDNRLVGRLFFQLIGLNTIILFYQIKSNHFYCHITTAQVPW